jgi:hypothetical protein
MKLDPARKMGVGTIVSLVIMIGFIIAGVYCDSRFFYGMILGFAVFLGFVHNLIKTTR